jgi:hypothetical protein
MENKINKEYLAILKYNNLQQLELEYIKLENLFQNELDLYYKVFLQNKKQEHDLNNLKKFFIENQKLHLLTSQKEYKYCQELGNPYEGFSININEIIINIDKFILLKNKFMQNKLTENDEKKFKESIKVFLNEEKENDITLNNFIDKILAYLYIKLKLWTHAYSIQKKYREAYDNNEILFFSHRLKGWSTPICKLNHSLSAEYKTNFGYGHSSYFYIKLKYKDIELIPFSDLVEYKFRNSFEINQYTQKYELENSEWEYALSFLVEAYNLLIKNEDEFIQKYMIDELVDLVNGLNKIFRNDHFEFKDNLKLSNSSTILYNSHTGEIINTENNKNKEYDKIETTILRAKKITNALDFIQKIYAYSHIKNININIKEIENLNSKMIPILINEKEKVEKEIILLTILIKKIQPSFFKNRDKNKDYENKKDILRKEYESQQEDEEFINSQFQQKYPEYEEFQENFKKISEQFIKLNNLCNRRVKGDRLL